MGKIHERPSTRLRATFALEADASAISLLVAWEMKSGGHPEAWTALVAWPTQADIATAFEKTLHETGDSDLAVTTAFYQWYGSPERRDSYYLSACSGYLDRQDSTHLLPLDQVIDTGFFDKLCQMPDGSR